MPLTYDFEFDWKLLNTCNYRCPYCFFPPEELGEKLKTYATVEEWRDAFAALRLTCMLHITGGEPTLYPNFVDLCAALTGRHYISLNTNLTHRSLAAFAQTVDPARVSFINASFHLEEREQRSDYESFLRHTGLLRAQGFPVLISLVATPGALARFEEAIEIVRPTGLAIIPKTFRGTFKGRNYPDGYTKAERRRFRQFNAVARQAYAAIFQRNGEWPTIDMLHDDEHVEIEPTFRGISCEAGRLFVRLDPNGDVFRCANDHLGNILKGTFTPKRRPAVCDTSYCYYFCKKYTLPDRGELRRHVDAAYVRLGRIKNRLASHRLN
jgi:MoaA/NifB/PqqE/SkfB family radical SAM enzyme